MSRSLARTLLSLVVPPLCVACGEPELGGAPVCPDCRAWLVPVADPRCRRCGAPGLHAARGGSPRCAECRGRRLAFARAWGAFTYEGAARKLVSALKVRGATAVAPMMAAELVRRAPPHLLAGTLVPVPAHPGRARRHGFNHARELARSVARITGRPWCDALARDGGRTQVGLERGARLRNARGSIRLRTARPAMPTGCMVTLVDDVYTTGATLDACASVLREAGAEQVFAITFARAVRG